MRDEYFHVLDGLFAIADGYDPAVREDTTSPFETTEQALRDASSEAIDRLRAAGFYSTGTPPG